MKNVLKTAILGGLFLAAAANAAIVITTDSTIGKSVTANNDELYYAGDVSGSDLLHGLAGTHSGWKNANGALDVSINDGNNGGDYGVSGLAALVGAAWANDSGTSSEFVLGSGNGTGFNISKIQSISAWTSGSGFPNQKYSVSVRYLGNTVYTPLTNAEYQPFPGTTAAAGGSVKITITNDAGFVASGIDAIKFSFLATTDTHSTASTVYREIDVFGVASGTDVTAPTVSVLSPVDGAAGVLTDRNLEVTFSEPVAIGSGNITITNLDTAASTVISVSNAQVSVSGTVLTINPTSDLATNSNYAVLIGTGAIKDLSGNSFTGIVASTTWNFATAGANPFATGKTKVFLLAGQSNMKGQGINSELTAPYNTAQTNVFFWDNGSWVDLAPGFGNTTDSFGPEVTFGHTVKQALPADNIVLIKYAANGTALYNDWTPVTGPEYITFTNTVRTALANLDASGADYEIAGMLWLQGESDAHEGMATNYDADLRNFIADMRTQFSNPALPFYIARVTTFYNSKGQIELVRSAQTNVAETTFNAEWFDTDSYVPLINGGHYGTAGQVAIGIDFANAYLNNDLITTNWPPMKIMALGDSITAGYTDNPTWSVAFNFGYRSGLYQCLFDAKTNVQFVGTSAEPFNNLYGDPTLGGTVKPEFDLRLLGQGGHEGYGGWKIPQIESIVASKLAANMPDVITLMIGINGIDSGSPAELNSLVGTILSNAPDVHLIVAQITPKSSYNADLYNYNAYIRNTLVPAYTNAGYNVTTVDMYSMYLTNLNDPTSINTNMFSNGINHPTPEVYDAMAEIWFRGITNPDGIVIEPPPVPVPITPFYNLQDDFDGVDDLAWSSTLVFNNLGVVSGAADANGNGSVALTLQANKTYTASLDIVLTTNAGNNYVSFGLFNGGITTASRHNNSSPAYIQYAPSAGAVSVKAGDTILGSSTDVGFSTSYTYKMVIVTAAVGTGATIDYSWINNVTGVTNVLATGQPLVDYTTVQHIGISGDTRSTTAPGYVDNFSLTRTPIDEYLNWAGEYGMNYNNYFGTNDLDSDGANNLYEYAFNGNPTNSAATGINPFVGKAGVAGGTNYIEYVHVERASTNSGITYTLQQTSNLISQAFSNSVDAVFVGEAVSGAYKSVTNRIPTDGKTAEYLRVKVEED
jgi:lysophospholipase L1-like esterase